jgi:hypothetical protein
MTFRERIHANWALIKEDYISRWLFFCQDIHCSAEYLKKWQPVNQNSTDGGYNWCRERSNRIGERKWDDVSSTINITLVHKEWRTGWPLWHALTWYINLPSDILVIWRTIMQEEVNQRRRLFRGNHRNLKYLNYARMATFIMGRSTITTLFWISPDENTMHRTVDKHLDVSYSMKRKKT